MAFFDGTREEYEGESAAIVAEERRLRRISEVEERVLLSAVLSWWRRSCPPRGEPARPLGRLDIGRRGARALRIPGDVSRQAPR
jgi:hypothetical protein